MLSQSFRPFSADHWAVLMFILFTAFALTLNKVRLQKIQDDRWLRYSWAIGLLGIELSTWFLYSSRGLVILPFQLCDWALFLTVIALLKGNRWACELSFFWGLAASSQAVLTPDLKEGFPSFVWISFFLTHSGVVLGAVYLLVRGKVQVSPASPWRVLLFTNFYAAVAGMVNWRLGTNFGYLAHKPTQPSLLDYFGPWPYYILWSELVALGLYFLCYFFARAVNRTTS